MAYLPPATRKSLEAAHKLFEAAKTLTQTPGEAQEHFYFVSTDPANPGHERITVSQALMIVAKTYQDARGRAWLDHLRSRRAPYFDVDGGRIQLDPP